VSRSSSGQRTSVVGSRAPRTVPANVRRRGHGGAEAHDRGSVAFLRPTWWAPQATPSTKRPEPQYSVSVSS